jgi:hypothetical protein
MMTNTENTNKELVVSVYNIQVKFLVLTSVRHGVSLNYQY